MRYIKYLILVLIITACEKINSPLDNPYDPESPIYSGNSPIITSIESIEDTLMTDNMYNSFVKINWQDTYSNITGYVIRRSDDGVNYIDIGSVDKNTLSFIDTCSDFTAFRYYTVSSTTEKNISPPSKPQKISCVCNLKLLYQIPGVVECSHIAFSPNRDIAAVLDYSSIKVIDLKTGSTIYTVTDVRSTTCSFNHDGRFFAYVSYIEPYSENSNFLFLIDSATGSELKRIPLVQGNASRIIITNDDMKAYIPFCSRNIYDDQFIVVDLANGRILNILPPKQDADISADGQKIIYTSGNYWFINNIDTWELVKRISGQEVQWPKNAIFDYDITKILIFVTGRGQYSPGNLSILDYESGTNTPIETDIDYEDGTFYVQKYPKYSCDGKFLFCNRKSAEGKTRFRVYYVSRLGEQYNYENVIVKKNILPSTMCFYPEGVGYSSTLSDAKFYGIHFSWEQVNISDK